MIDLFEGIVEDGLKPLFDPRIEEKNRKAIADYRLELDATVKDAIMDHRKELESAEPDLREHVKRVNEELQEAGEALESLREAIDDLPMSWIEAKDKVRWDLPKLDIPEAEAEIGGGILFDSDEPYEEQRARVKNYEETGMLE